MYIQEHSTKLVSHCGCENPDLIFQTGIDGAFNAIHYVKSDWDLGYLTENTSCICLWKLKSLKNAPDNKVQE